MGIALSLFKFSDALQIPLEYNSGKISGECSGAITTSVGLRIPFTIEAQKVFYNEQCGIVAHVRGDLYILLSHFPQTGGIGAYIIDGGKLLMDGVKTPPGLFISKTFSMTEVFAALKHSIVAGFRWSQSEWKPLKLPA